MLDPKRIRQQEKIKDALILKGCSPDLLDHYIESDESWRQALVEIDDLKSKRNAMLPKGKPSEEQLQVLKKFVPPLSNSVLQQAIMKAIMKAMLRSRNNISSRC